MRIECVLPAEAVLGEGPIWDERRQCVWWIDIKAPTLHAYWPETRRTRELSLSSTIGSIGLRENDGIVAGMRNGFTFIDPDSGDVTGICNPEAHYPHNRFNDGRVDAAGRFWAGTMDDLEKDKSGQLYRLDPHGKATQFPANFVVTNGIDWTVDGRTMYFVDTTENTIYAYDFDMASGMPGEKRVFARVPEGNGHPDGLTVDGEDHVWSAHWNGWRLTRYRPDGSIERVVQMPVPLVTKCCFGGPDLDIMFVTTASVNLDAETRAKAPLSGGFFAIHGLGVTGKLDGRFQG